MNLKKYVLGPSFSAFFLTVLPLVTSSIVGNWIVNNEQVVQQFSILDWGFLTIFCAFAAALGFLPPTLLALCFGYFLGWVAFLPLVLLNFAAIGLIYGIIQFVDLAFWRTFFETNPKTAVFFERMHQNQPLFIFFTKLSPLLPFALTNALFAISGIRFKNVILGGFFGMIPRTLLAIWLGKEAHQIRQLLNNPDESVWSRVFVAALVTVSVLGLVRIFMRRS
jgi:uncharacterized membrane protein YdjX (TVP38/TMEM64 family)